MIEASELPLGEQIATRAQIACAIMLGGAVLLQAYTDPLFLPAKFLDTLLALRNIGRNSIPARLTEAPL